MATTAMQKATAHLIRGIETVNRADVAYKLAGDTDFSARQKLLDARSSALKDFEETADLDPNEFRALDNAISQALALHRHDHAEMLSKKWVARAGVADIEKARAWRAYAAILWDRSNNFPPTQAIRDQLRAQAIEQLSSIIQFLENSKATGREIELAIAHEKQGQMLSHIPRRRLARQALLKALAIFQRLGHESGVTRITDLLDK